MRNAEINTLRDELARAMDKIDRLEKSQAAPEKRLLSVKWGSQAMKGLCHGCFTSNIEIVVAQGSILCADCLDTSKNKERE